MSIPPKTILGKIYVFLRRKIAENDISKHCVVTRMKKGKRQITANLFKNLTSTFAGLSRRVQLSIPQPIAARNRRPKGFTQARPQLRHCQH